MPIKLLEQVELSIQSGKHVEAKRQIAKIKKSYALKAQDRVRIADFLYRLGDLKGALKTLATGTESTLEPSVLISYAQMLNQVGAWKMALRKLDQLTQRKISLDSSRIIAEIYLTLYEFEKGLSFAQKLRQEVESTDTRRQILDQILLADLLEGSGKWQEAVSLLVSLNEKILKTDKVLLAILLQAESEYLIKADQKHTFSRCESNLKKAIELFTSETATKDYAYALKWLGVLHLKKKEFSQAKLYLEKALSILKSSKTRATALIEVLYFLQFVRPLNCIESLFLQFYPLPSIWKSNLEGDCILIENNTTTSVFYSKVNFSKALDLISNKTLSDQDLKILTLILCASDYGISIFTLIDQIFDSDFIDLSYPLKRIEFSLKKINSLIPLIRKDNWIRLKEIPTACIFPKLDWVEKRDFLLLERLNSDFSVSDIQKILKVSAASARRLRKKWNVK